MILADVNVLVYAFRTDSLEHPRYREWLDSVLNGQSAYGVSPREVLRYSLRQYGELK